MERTIPRRRVVITGMGALSSVGNNVPTMWEALVKGTNGIAPITQFDTGDSKVKLAGEVKGFDPSPVLSPRDARRLDRVIQFGMVAADEAYRQAGLSSLSVDPYRFGTFVTSGIGGITTIWQEAIVAYTKGIDRISPFFVPNGIINLIGANISIRYGAKGPNLPVVTACSAGTNAIGEAFRYIRDGSIDLAFAGGTEAGINPLAIGAFASMRALSFSSDPETACTPFDQRRSGFVMAEGAGVLILEERDHALNRGVKILAEITGYATTSDAFHITAPDETGEAIAVCLKMAMADAEISPDQVDYLNAHGTATVLNDRIETLAIKKAFGETAQTLKISSTKSMTGHSMGATGAIESIIAIQAIRTGIIPPTIHLEEPDPECDLDYTPNGAFAKSVACSMNLNMGFGGQNAAVVFQKHL